MKTSMTEKMLCPCCMEEHNVQKITVREKNVFKGVPVRYAAEYWYCDRTDETYADEQQIASNDIAMKNAYREKTGLLTSRQIAAIRAKYGISQSDLCLLLGWGLKTITRYESHQVQDIAHDTILRKLDCDPEWFLQLLKAEKDSLSAAAYTKYAEAAAVLFEKNYDQYLKSAIMSKYVRFLHNTQANGGKELSLDAVIEIIRYYANSDSVADLHKSKLMRMLWYADALSFKRRKAAITGLVYLAADAGIVPLAYELIFGLSAVNCEEVEIGESSGTVFLPVNHQKYPHLTLGDTEILDEVIHRFGKASVREIDEIMHQEEAYIQTAPDDVIRFQFTDTLSLTRNFLHLGTISMI